MSSRFVTYGSTSLSSPGGPAGSGPHSLFSPPPLPPPPLLTPSLAGSGGRGGGGGGGGGARPGPASSSSSSSGGSSSNGVGSGKAAYKGTNGAGGAGVRLLDGEEEGDDDEVGGSGGARGGMEWGTTPGKRGGDATHTTPPATYNGEAAGVVAEVSPDGTTAYANPYRASDAARSLGAGGAASPAPGISMSRIAFLGGGAGGAATPGGAAGGGGIVAVPKTLLLDVLEARRYRAAKCRSVPMSVVMYIFFIICMLTHVRIAPGYDFERALVDGIVNAGGGFWVTTDNDWFTWMHDVFIPAALADSDPALGVVPENRGYFGQYSLIVGGVRLVQTRSKLSSCAALSAPLQRAYGDECYPFDKLSAEAFGNATEAAAAGVEGAFLPVAPQLQDGSEAGGAEFEFYLNVEDDMPINLGYLEALQATQWLDAATRTVRVQVALINGEQGAYGRVEFAATFTRGSRVATSTSVISIASSFYDNGRSYLYFFDVIFIVYWLYLVWGAVRRQVKALRTSRSCCACLSASTSYFRLLDLAVVGSLLVAIVAWVVTCTRLVSITTYVASVPASPSAFATGPSDIQNRIYEATNAYGVFKEAAVVTLIFLTLRLFKYFQFQPRLAVMTEVFSRGASDALHFGFLFGLLLCMYGVWGHFMFGTQAPDWADVRTSALSVFRAVMYDYDLPAMEAQYRGMADLFYITFMIAITNLVLWMFLAILLENYTEVRYESHKGASAWQEATAYLATLPRTLSPRCCCARRRAGATPRLLGDMSWAAIAQAVRTHTDTRAADVITPALLSRAVSVSEASADLFLRDILASAAVVGGTRSTTEAESEVLAGALYGALHPTAVSAWEEKLPPRVLGSRGVPPMSQSARAREASAAILLSSPVATATIGAASQEAAAAAVQATDTTLRALQSQIAHLTAMVASLQAARIPPPP